MHGSGCRCERQPGCFDLLCCLSCICGALLACLLPRGAGFLIRSTGAFGAQPGPFTSSLSPCPLRPQPYAVFIWLRRVFGTGEHWRWGALAQPTREVRGALQLTPLAVSWLRCSCCSSGLHNFAGGHKSAAAAVPSLASLWPVLSCPLPVQPAAAGAGSAVVPRPGVAPQPAVHLLAAVAPAPPAAAGKGGAGAVGRWPCSAVARPDDIGNCSLIVALHA